MTSNNKPSFSPKEHHYPQLCKILNMEDLPAKISKTVNQRNYILALNCNKLIGKSLRSGLEKKRRNLDRKLNRNYNFKVNFCQFEENKKQESQVASCRAVFFFLYCLICSAFLVYLLQYLKDTINIIPQTTKRYEILCENRVTPI